jgi:hypothetical protein
MKIAAVALAHRRGSWWKGARPALLSFNTGAADPGHADFDWMRVRQQVGADVAKDATHSHCHSHIGDFEAAALTCAPRKNPGVRHG